MSILLDAVTRAKQQDQLIDPVITPRAQYQAMNQGHHLGLKVSLFIAFLLLAVVLAWLLSSASPLKPQPDMGKAPVVEASQVAQDAPKASPRVTDIDVTDISDKDVQLAGKVALPVAIERPVVTPSPVSNTAAHNQPKVTAQDNLAKGSSTIAVATQVEEDGGDEPIILGANSNRRGQALLNALKTQVDEAAEDVGLAPSQANTESKEIPSTHLVAAFEAALKEVEKSNAIATPVTEPKLDPIPESKPDELPKYGQLPGSVQLQVPEFNILAHVYASDPNNRWLNVDGAELQQGDMIAGKLTIVEIRPRDVVLEVAGTQFKVPAI
jgi:general secretion pathway protein B